MVRIFNDWQKTLDNIDDESYFLSNINLRESDNGQKTFYEVKNIQQLNSVISKEFKKINLD